MNNRIIAIFAVMMLGMLIKQIIDTVEVNRLLEKKHNDLKMEIVEERRLLNELSLRMKNNKRQ
jgi:hypothetical protein